MSALQNIMIFKRYEKKYRLNKEQIDKLMSLIKNRIVPDRYGRNTICSLYLDTPDYLLIRNSIDAEDYKEKLRVRSYGVPGTEKYLFFEIKKKCEGIVYKRRVVMTPDEAFEYINSGIVPINSQIMKEIDYAMKLYKNPKPSLCIICEREAYFASDDENVRLTFDTNLRYRRDFPSKDNVEDGIHISGDDECILEIKTAGAMPLWLAHALTECKIYPQGFSKYGNAYYDIIKREEV